MSDEILVCSVHDFLEKFAPFSPDARWIDSAYDCLREKKLLQTNAETTARRNTVTASRARAAAAGGAPAHETDAKEKDTVLCQAYHYATLDQIEKNDMKTWKLLATILDALHDCPDPCCTRISNGYRYTDCSRQGMIPEVMGVNFEADAVIANSDIYKEGEEDIGLAAARTAVVMEFKKEATPEMVHENRKRLVGAANHIMNDDPRRNWTYGDFKTFIRVFLSFLYATDGELGHDPSIHRMRYGKEWCYVYELKTEEGPKYYRTIKQLYNPRSDCIAGHKSRVWKVVEVAGLNKLKSAPGDREVVLKDCWVDEGSLSEKEIQTQIFGRLRNIKEADYAWATSGLREKLKDGLAHPETYFVKVELDWKEEPGMRKEKPKYELAPDLLARPDTSSNASSGKVILSSQTSARTAYPSSSAFNSSRPGSDTGRSASKRYKVKRHYRVVYADVGESLAYTKHLCDAVKAFEHIFIALTLLLLAGWVHRDVSAGNIILVRNGDSVQGKLSDLEFARDFDEVVSADATTGTLYFMPIEMHSEGFLFPKLPSTVYSLCDQNQTVPSHKAVSRSLKYIFIHDLESLWWILVWIFLLHITGSKPLDMVIFTTDSTPHKDRREFFTMGDSLLSYLESFMHDLLCDRLAPKYLSVYNHTIFRFYATGKREDMASYHNIYDTLWRQTRIFIDKMEGIELELGDRSNHIHPASAADPQELVKRMRSTDGGSSTNRRGSVEGPSEKKKQKASEHNAEKGTTQDMAGVACKDGLWT